MRLTKAGRHLLGLGTPSSFDVDFRRRVRRGALVAGLFGLALTCALASKAAAVGTTATASDTPASAPSTSTTVGLVPAAPAPAPGAQLQAAATPAPAPGAEPQEPATREPAPGAEPQEPATPELESPGTSAPELALRAEPQSPGIPEPAPRAEPQAALATAPAVTDPASIVTQTEAAFPPVARAVRAAPRRPANLSAAAPRRAAASSLPFAASSLPFALPPDADVTSLPALGPSASSRGPAAAGIDRTKRRRAEGADVDQGPRSPLGPLDRTFPAASSAAPGGGAAPDLIWCTILLGLAAYPPQTLRRHCVRQLARRLVGFASFHEQPG